MLKDDLGMRMKTFYEQIPKIKLMRRTPVIIRIDGKAFHTFTRGFVKPFDEILIQAMQETTRYLCENIQGCVLGYCQSDEISLVLVDYQRFESSAWFDYEVQKMCSIAASMATMAFNRSFAKNVQTFASDEKSVADSKEIAVEKNNRRKADKNEQKYIDTLNKAVEKGAMFDARVFNLPKEEVTNYIYWRQLDASRNSIQMVGQANFSQKELQGKSRSDIQDMLMLQKNINWNDFPVVQKRGTCVVKEEYYACQTDIEEMMLEQNAAFKKEEEGSGNMVKRTRWVIDQNIPIFKGTDREYIDKLVYVEGD